MYTNEKIIFKGVCVKKILNQTKTNKKANVMILCPIPEKNMNIDISISHGTYFYTICPYR